MPGNASRTRSRPFCSTSRVTTPITGPATGDEAELGDAAPRGRPPCRQVLERVRLGEAAVHRGIPHLVVDAVDDAVQIVTALLQHSLEPAAERGGADLARVGAADRGEQVGEDEPALEEVELAVELDAGRCEQVPAEPGHRHVVVPEHALVGEVVDGEERARSPPRRGWSRYSVRRYTGTRPVCQSLAWTICGRQGPPPVSGSCGDRFETAPAEEDEPLAVVPVVAVGGAVQALAIVVVVAARGSRSARPPRCGPRAARPPPRDRRAGCETPAPPARARPRGWPRAGTAA